MEIRIEHLSMTYPSGKQALKDLDLELKAPSLIGLLGPNGAGKSTLMKLLVAALLPTRGEILVDGQPLTRTERLFYEQEANQENGLHITARVNTAQGVRCRVVADQLPTFVQPEEPTLEDAYLYLISREAAQ